MMNDFMQLTRATVPCTNVTFSSLKTKVVAKWIPPWMDHHDSRWHKPDSRAHLKEQAEARSTFLQYISQHWRRTRTITSATPVPRATLLPQINFHTRAAYSHPTFQIIPPYTTNLRHHTTTHFHMHNTIFRHLQPAQRIRSKTPQCYASESS